jgi:hypothetical protein
MWTAVTADPMLRPEDEVGVQRQVTVPTGANIPVLSHEPGILVAMHAHSGRRYRAYPTPGQAERLTGWGHSCRAVWNLALEQRRFAWRQRARTLRSAEQCRHLTDARADLPWLADLPAQSAQQVLRQLDRAYDNWWNPEHPAQAPTFRKRSGLSIPFPGQAVQVRSAPAGGLKCDCRSLDGFGFGCPARSAARCATPRSPRTPSAGTSRSEWRLPPNPPHRTACRAVGWTSEWPARRSFPTSGNRA